jgi:preprotein translocase subunit YajC
MSRKILLACTVTLSLLALAAPILAQTTQPSGGGAERTPPELRTPPEPRTGSGTTAAPAATADANSKAALEDANATTHQPAGGFWNQQTMILALMVGVIVLMVVLNSRTRRKQEKKRTNMIAGMKKGDRVTTIGGIIGTLIEVRDNDVVVKVDEQNNTRLRFLRSAIHHVGEPLAEKDQQQK